MSEISIFAHHAMTTKWEIRIAGEDPTYAAQAAMAAFEWADRIEGLLSRFREESELSVIARLAPGGRFRLSELTFACLSLARECEVATGAAFSLGATAVRLGQARPAWRLNAASRELVVERAPCLLDAGAIGKGFALDRMAEELTEWSVASFSPARPRPERRDGRSAWGRSRGAMNSISSALDLARLGFP